MRIVRISQCSKIAPMERIPQCRAETTVLRYQLFGKINGDPLWMLITSEILCESLIQVNIDRKILERLLI